MGKEKDTKRVPFAEWVSTFGKDYKNSITKASITPRYEKIPSKAIGMTYAMCGGWPHGGRLYEIAGPNSTGKTTLAFRAIGDFLDAFSDKKVLFIDVEQSLDIEYQCRMNGIDSNRVYIWKPKVGMSGEQILGSILDMSMQIEDISLIVIDSIPALIPSIDLEEEFEKDNGMRGTLAKYLYKWLRESLPILAEYKIDLLALNQTRVKGKTYTGTDILDEPCGEALKYYSSIRIRCGKKVFVDENGEELEYKKESATQKAQNPTTGEGASGIRINFAITKSKVASTARGGGYVTYLNNSGLAYVHDLYEVASKLGFVDKVNQSRYQLLDVDTKEPLNDENGKPLYGYEKDLLNYLNTHEEFTKNYLEKLSNKLSQSQDTLGNLLDEIIAKEIADEEKAVAGSSVISTKDFENDEE